VHVAEVACWMHTGERQAAKMRLAYLRAMLDQDIAVFDTEASTGEVINAITSDILVVQDAISEKVRTPTAHVAVHPFTSARVAILAVAPTAAQAGRAEGGKDERN
jgi:ABC-type multidrug transport system fused ATPase/permease subunit